MTDNHDYHTPRRGTANWHVPLNENFSRLDTDVEIRDADENRDQYRPKPNAKFLATDTGRVYIGTGDRWEHVVSTGNDATFDSVSTGATNGTDDHIGIEPFADALREGYVVGLTNGYQTVVDPRDYPSDADALQAANDDLAGNFPESERTGYVYLPPLRPDGTELEIGKTVVFGSETDDVEVIPRGWGFRSPSGPLIQCRIDNGDPMFVVASSTRVRGTTAQFGGFAADGNGNDAEFLRLRNVASFHLARVHARHFDSATAAGVYVFDGGCYNGYINRTTYVASQVHCPDADVWVLRNDTGDGPPGELKFGPGNTTYAAPSYPFNSGYRCEVSASDIVWGGRIEGAGGDGLVYQTGGYLFLSSYTELGRVEGTDTDKVYFDGYMLNISPAISLGSNGTGSEGHGVHVESMARGSIPSLPNDGIQGDVVHVDEDNGSANYVVVPYEGTFNGSVGYPDPPWRQLVYPDGWQRLRAGTTTIQPNATTRLTGAAGDAGTPVRLTDLTVASEPTGDPRFREVRGWEGGDQWVGIEETNGASFELSWELHRKA